MGPVRKRAETIKAKTCGATIGSFMGQRMQIPLRPLKSSSMSRFVTSLGQAGLRR